MSTATSSIHSSTQSARPSLLARTVGARGPLQVQRALWGYLFALPWVLGLLIFWIGPIIASAYYSFTSFELVGSPKWTGLANYQRAFGQDDLFWTALGKTFFYTAIYVPIAVIGALLLALVLNQKLKGTNIYRTVFFMPSLIPAVALTVVWTFLLAPRLGPINEFLRTLGMSDPPKWLADRDSALYSVTMINVWAAMGGNTMLIFLAALQGVPRELQEAAEIDGAGAWSRFRHVTLPLISPTIFFNLILTIIAALKVFVTAWVAVKGGPSYATWFFALHIYNEAFVNFKLGYASALAWVLVVILLVFTYIQMVYSRRWVHYESN